jgi:Flp pilus assembly protein TadG
MVHTVGLQQRFATDRAGTVGIIFGLCSVVVVACVGAAIDYGRWSHARLQSQHALDAAVLAATRTAAENDGDEASATKVGEATFQAMKPKYITGEPKLTLTPAYGGFTYSGHAETSVNMPFLSIIGVSSFPIAVDTVARIQISDSGSDVEVAMMLDMSGSMCDIVPSNAAPGCLRSVKLDALKVAAEDFVDIIVWDDQSRYTSRISLVPFSAAVNAGAYYSDATNLPVRESTCVVERVGVNALTDAPPGPGSWPQSWNFNPDGTVRMRQYTKHPALNFLLTSATSCFMETPIQPLTADKSVLHRTIRNLTAKSGTSGALSTAWAWYTISPEWGAIFRGEHAPLPYSQTRELNSFGKPKLYKVAVLMTDGDFNEGLAIYDHYIDGEWTKTIRANAVALCKNMKSKGIIIYTIGFQLTNEASRDTLRACASNGELDEKEVRRQLQGVFIEAKTPQQLKSAFRNIAKEISSLRITR